MKLDKMLKLTGLVGAFTLAVGCAGPAEKAEEPVANEPAVVQAQPVEAPMAETMPMEPMGMAMESYEVNSGDHLWGISAKSSVYGNPYKWPLIYKANSDKITDADLIHPGQVLDINTNPGDAESSAAINHAKTRGSWSIGVTEDSDKAYLAQ